MTCPNCDRELNTVQEKTMYCGKCLIVFCPHCIKYIPVCPKCNEVYEEESE